MKNLLLIVKYVLMTPWCPANKLELYKIMILSEHVFGTARTVISFSGVILNNSESNRMYLSANVSTVLIDALEVSNLFCDNTDINQ